MAGCWQHVSVFPAPQLVTDTESQHPLPSPPKASLGTVRAKHHSSDGAGQHHTPFEAEVEPFMLPFSARFVFAASHATLWFKVCPQATNTKLPCMANSHQFQLQQYTPLVSWPHCTAPHTASAPAAAELMRIALMVPPKAWSPGILSQAVAARCISTC